VIGGPLGWGVLKNALLRVRKVRLVNAFGDFRH
jgi:hypothetical protein